MSYRISPRANADIEAICDYIARDNPDAADRLDDRIHDAITLLAQFPGMGHARTDVKDRRYMFWTVGNYVIAYRGACSAWSAQFSPAIQECQS